MTEQSPLKKKKRPSKKLFIKIVISFFLISFVMVLMGAMAYLEATM